MDDHVDHLAADFRYPAPVLVLQEKDPPLALPVLTLMTLGPVGLFACLDDRCAVTVRTLYRDIDHLFPPHVITMWGDHTGKLLICNITAPTRSAPRSRSSS